MKTVRTSMLIALLLGACAPATRTATLRADARLQGGGESVITLTAPGDWFQATKRADKAEFVASDNFARLSVSSVPVLADAAKCPELAMRAAQDAGNELRRGAAAAVEVKPLADAPDAAEFRLAVPGTPPGPTDRVIVGRAVCRAGAMAVASCSISAPRKIQLLPVCEQALASLKVEAAK